MSETTMGAKDFRYLRKKLLMKSQGRVECEIDDLMRLYLSKRNDVLQIAAEDLVERMVELKDDLEDRWNDDLGTGMELMETMILGYLAGTMQKYVAGKITGKEKKHHDEDCLLNGVI